jgi:pimeloyl-ACP methyl ester carboxylesterase
MRAPRHPGLHDARGHELPHRLIDVCGTETYVVDHGDGPPVLLVHGYGDTADGWRRVVPGLIDAHRVIVPDVPPFGRSQTVDSRVDLMDFYGRFFPELLERLGVERATVIGHSLGGAISLRIAIERPDLVERLGLVAPAGLGKGPPWWWFALVGNGILWKGALSVPGPITPRVARQCLKRFLDWRLFHDPRNLAKDIEHLVELHHRPRDLGALLAAGRACIGSYTGTLLDDSRAIPCPIWMVWGDHDGLVPVADARAFESAHPQAQVHVFDRCGHYPQIEFPRRFNTLLRDWIDATAGDSAPLAEAA